MSTRGFYNTDKHTCETHTRTHPDFASSCRWDLVRQVFTPVISHHLARHCLWQPHQPHNEDTWGKRRHRLSIKLLRREATAKWDIIMDIMEMFKHQGSLILFIYIYITKMKNMYTGVWFWIPALLCDKDSPWSQLFGAGRQGSLHGWWWLPL